MSTSERFLENLEIIRIRRGIPKAELARRVGLSGAGLSQMLRRRTIRLEKIEALARALGVEPCAFFKQQDSL